MYFYKYKFLKFHIKFLSSNILFSILLTIILGLLIYLKERNNENKLIFKKIICFFSGLIMNLSFNIFINSYIYCSDKNIIFFTKFDFKDMCLLFSGSELICILIFSIIYIESYIFISSDELSNSFKNIFKIFSFLLFLLLFYIFSLIIFLSKKWFLIFYSLIFSLCLIIPSFIVILNSLVKKHKSGILIFK